MNRLITTFTKSALLITLCFTSFFVKAQIYSLGNNMGDLNFVSTTTTRSCSLNLTISGATATITTGKLFVKVHTYALPNPEILDSVVLPANINGLYGFMFKDLDPHENYPCEIWIKSNIGISQVVYPSFTTQPVKNFFDHVKNINVSNILATGSRVTFFYDTTFCPMSVLFFYDTTHTMQTERGISVGIEGFNQKGPYATNYTKPGWYSFVFNFSSTNYGTPFFNRMILNKDIYWRFVFQDNSLDQNVEKTIIDTFRTSLKYTDISVLSTGINGAVIKASLFGLAQPKVNIRVVPYGEGINDTNSKTIYSVDTNLSVKGNYYELIFPLRNLSSGSGYIIYMTAILNGDTVTTERNFDLPQSFSTHICASASIGVNSIQTKKSDTVSFVLPITYPGSAGSSWVKYKIKITKTNGQILKYSEGEKLLRYYNVGVNFLEDTLKVSMAGITTSDYKATVQLVDPCGFVNTMEFINSTSGIRQVAKVSTILYPNPFTDHVTIVTETEKDFVVIDNTGRQVYAGTVANSIELPTNSWATGIYVIKFSDGSIQKLVKR